jgi:hypothetical protein
MDLLFWEQNFRSYHGEIRISPSEESIKTVLDHIRTLIFSRHYEEITDMIRDLNLVITGWSRYHRFFPDRNIADEMDREVTQMLWDWVKSHHPSEKEDQITKRYFIQNQTSNGKFHLNGVLIQSFHEQAIEYPSPVRVDQNPYLDRKYGQTHREGYERDQERNHDPIISRYPPAFWVL